MLRFVILACAVSAIQGAIIGSTCGSPQIPPNEMSMNIVGGEPARPHSWPWMTEILERPTMQDPFRQYCGATIINEEWLVSAAHCFPRNPNLSGNIGRYQFSVGGHESLNLEESTRQTFWAKEIIRHENYDWITAANDIALIKINGTIDLTVESAEKVCLPEQGIRPAREGDMVYVTGWGDQEKVRYDAELQQVNVPIVSTTVCEDAYGSIDDSMICAGYTQGGKDSCQGDSGGPMVVQEGETWTLAGIVSWGQGCADRGYYGVYADVSHLRNWISTHTGI